MRPEPNWNSLFLRFILHSWVVSPLRATLHHSRSLDSPLSSLGLISCEFRSVVYMTAMGILFPCLIVVYLQTCSGRSTHNVPNYRVPEPQSITKPYECRSDASLDFCSKDNCKMRWKPPGTHHCSTCGVCRFGFDHHCPWVREVNHPILDVTY